MTEIAKPYHAKPYKIPFKFTEVVKEEIYSLVSENILENVKHDTQWAAPTFAVAKKNGGARIVTDFRILNSMIKRSLWPMPHLRELLFRCAGMTFATALDLIMGYFGIWLKEHIKDLCTISYHSENFVICSAHEAKNIS